MTSALEYLKRANEPGGDGKPLVVDLVTNFTDGVLQKLLNGVLREEGFVPEVRAVPYRQYHLHLKDRAKVAAAVPAGITFMFFDVNPYRRSAFFDDSTHIANVLDDITAYAEASSGPVVVATFPVPYTGPYGNLFSENPLYVLITEANTRLRELARTTPNLHMWDVNALIHRMGEKNIRDLRGLYAFDIPFTSDFLLAIAREWAALLRAKEGKAKKCIVLDCDNTLWGGIVGEVGPTGIALGPDDPAGLAFQNFQHALRSLSDRGVILAINSRNNEADVREVFTTHPHMALREEHFATMRINWEDKATNIASIAEELNIGVDSMVFIDDDPVNRDLVRTVHPGVLVPELPERPEAYAALLYELDAFHQLALTDEDRARRNMYTADRARRNVERAAQNIDEYIAILHVTLDVVVNDTGALPRAAQLTQKTNQFNLTTKRRTEGEIALLVERGALVMTADVRDKFGNYGKTVLAIVTREGDGSADLDTFLMSCRVMGRRVEYAFMRAVAETLRARGVTRLTASFSPTAKNTPAANFLPSLRFSETGREGETVRYAVNVVDLERNASVLSKDLAVTIHE